MCAILRRVFALLCCSVSLLAWGAEDPEGRSWLERMSQALSSRNYEGRFVHMNEVRTETMRIIHRSMDGAVTERLVALDGSGREIVRTDGEVTCYLPDKRTVLVTKRSDKNTLVANLPVYSDELQSLYEIKMGASSKLLGRPTQLISVQPRDEFRYGYKLWLDAETAMPLKSQLSSRDGRVVEQMAFAELQMRDAIAPDELKPVVDTQGFRRLTQEAPTTPAEVGSGGWAVVRLPPGFRLTITRVQSMAGSRALVRHMVYSDGLASVSVFIEPKPAQAMHGLGRVGAASAYSIDFNGHQITAVGEVPPVTVESIATAVEPASK
jgi:sigma-E factor negative regulatory protein RseB